MATCRYCRILLCNFKDWVYQPAAQKKDESPILKPTTNVTQVFIQAFPASATNPPTTLSAQPTNGVLIDHIKQSLVESSPSLSSGSTSATIAGISASMPETNINGFILSQTEDTPFNTNQSVTISSTEPNEKKRIPVYLQRVSYQPMSCDLPGRNHVSAITKGMLASKIGQSRPQTGSQGLQQRNLLLAPTDHVTRAQASIVPKPVKLLPSMLNKVCRLRSSLVTNVPLMDGVRQNSKLSYIKIINIHKIKR